ncbi:hypothetical protein THAOC_31012 [Thalassiosira oceanica]|uniref:Uncharacterized protein n=1 Tax=Thalassiosira oceanica TaxID=159749 RepID=K0RA63_THAOC|nr:hypothetical protein THAOC_31012 [Thalassiosira oceanica]|eukprot:EJK50055.1 hypothetical protein THAOC_31012 [Thalassiosira oceanica]
MPSNRWEAPAVPMPTPRRPPPVLTSSRGPADPSDSSVPERVPEIQYSAPRRARAAPPCNLQEGPSPRGRDIWRHDELAGLGDVPGPSTGPQGTRRHPFPTDVDAAPCVIHKTNNLLRDLQPQPYEPACDRAVPAFGEALSAKDAGRANARQDQAPAEGQEKEDEPLYPEQEPRCANEGEGFTDVILSIASRFWALHPMFWGPLWGRGPSVGPVLETPGNPKHASKMTIVQTATFVKAVPKLLP